MQSVFRREIDYPQAVAACQLLEVAFTICVKLVFRHTGAVDLRSVAPLEKDFSRPPTRALLNELKKYVDVRSDFEEALNDVIERRHLLIHRWSLERSWPNPDNANGQGELAKFAAILARDAVGLGQLVTCYVFEWMQKFPALAQNLRPLEKDWLARVPDHLRDLTIESSES